MFLKNAPGFPIGPRVPPKNKEKESVLNLLYLYACICIPGETLFSLFFSLTTKKEKFILFGDCYFSFVKHLLFSWFHLTTYFSFFLFSLSKKRPKTCLFLKERRKRYKKRTKERFAFLFIYFMLSFLFLFCSLSFCFFWLERKREKECNYLLPKKNKTFCTMSDRTRFLFVISKKRKTLVGNALFVCYLQKRKTPVNKNALFVC